VGILADLGIIRGHTLKTARIFEELVGDFFKTPASGASDYVRRCWREYLEHHPHEDVGTNGKFFELCLATLFVREGIIPFYVQARIAFVPNIVYDLILYTQDSGPVCISAKTTLRERYKQADLEALALKHVHRRAKSYLINISESENLKLQQKIKNGDVMGLDGSIFAFGAELDKFIVSLKKRPLAIAPEVRVIQSDTIITKEAVDRFSQRPKQHRDRMGG
jgi:hypothetical protein